jgi:hypothetical protein
MTVSNKPHLVVNVHCISAKYRVHGVGLDDGRVFAVDRDFILGVMTEFSPQALPTCVQVNSRMSRTSILIQLVAFTNSANCSFFVVGWNAHKVQGPGTVRQVLYTICGTC